MGDIGPVRRIAALACVLAGLCTAPAARAAGASPAAPGNDARAAAQVIRALPATLGGTLVGSTAEQLEPTAGCAGPSEHTAWSEFRAGEEKRLALAPAAAGGA